MISNIPTNDAVNQGPQYSTYLPSPDQAQKLFDMGQLDAPTAKKLGAQVDPALVDATIAVESGGRSNAVSPKGATGLMQIMPATGAEVAQQLGMTKYDLTNDNDNKAIGQEYLGQQLEKYGSKELASAALNAGPGAVDRAIEKAGSTDPQAVLQYLPKETQNYVPKVMADYQARTGGAADVSDYGANSSPTPQPSAKVLGVVSNVASPNGTTPDPFTLKSEAVERGTQVGIEKAQAEAVYMRERVAQQDQILKEQQEKEIQRQEQIKQQEQKAQQALDEFSKAKIDPNRFWDSKSTGEKIVAGIAIALGALGQGLSKGTIQSNGALDIINGAINRDIEAQKMAILGKKETADGAKGILAQMRERFDDERVAESMARVISLDQAKLKLDEIASKSKSAEVAANKDLLLAQIEEERQKNAIELSKAINDGIKVRTEAQKVANESPVNRRQMMEAVVKGVKTEDGKTQKLDPEMLTEKDRERYVPGLGIATTADDAKKLKEAQIAYKKFDNLLGEMIQSRQASGAELYGAEKEKQKARATEALLSIKDMENLGALDAGAVKVGGRIIPENPAEFRWSGDPVAELQEVKRRALMNFNEKVKSMLSVPSNEANQQLNKTGSVSSFTPKG